MRQVAGDGCKTSEKWTIAGSSKHNLNMSQLGPFMWG
jgi:hypothetical protein